MLRSVSTAPTGAMGFSERSFKSCKFGTVVHALAGRHKPAAWLAEKLGCTERGARYLIDGERSVTAYALKVIIDEILDR